MLKNRHGGTPFVRPQLAEAAPRCDKSVFAYLQIFELILKRSNTDVDWLRGHNGRRIRLIPNTMLATTTEAMMMSHTLSACIEHLQLTKRGNFSDGLT